MSGVVSKIFTIPNFDNFDADEYFKNFHYYELFDETKEYNTTKFKADYGNGSNTYKFYCYILKNSNSSEEKKFIVAEEKSSVDEYCKCNVCNLIICNCHNNLNEEYEFGIYSVGAVGVIGFVFIMCAYYGFF